MKSTGILLIALLSSVSAASLPGQAALEVDVLVYGGTSAGVIAAYTAKAYGKHVLLVEPGRHLGGMTSGGLGQTDIGNKFAADAVLLVPVREKEASMPPSPRD